MTAAKKMLACRITTSNTILRVEPGMYPGKANRDMRRLKWKYEVRSMPKKRRCQPELIDLSVWEKVTKERAGIRWDNVVEKVWECLGGHQEEMM